MKLSCHNLTRKFGDTTALNGVNLCLDEPKIYGLLGRNGAGKTTLLRLITNYIQPTEGTITLDEQNVWENEKAQHQIFLVTETSYFAEMNAHKLIQLMSEIYPSFDKQQCLDYAKRFELDLNKKYTALSTGYKSVLRAVLSLSVHTPFLFLDEPTLGMDAFHRELFYKLLIESYSESPSCILLSTHLISEVEGLLENVIILDHGKVLIDACIEAYPSFVSIVESDIRRIRGRFLPTALSHAAPFGITVAVMISVFSLLAPFGVEQRQTTMYMLLILISMGAVIKSCIPLTWLRAFVCVTMVGGTFFALAILPSLFEITAITIPMATAVLIGAAACLVEILILEQVRKTMVK